jgi:uncharacterized membrane protein YfcA
MTPAFIALVSLVMVATSLLSGVFGMAGGLILVGVLLALMPVPDAMVLHAVTQIASNGWRAALWIRHARLRIVAAYAAGCLAALVLWSVVRFVPSRPLALIALGASPFLLHLLPRRWRPDAGNPRHGAACGAASMSLMLLTGVAGPLLDSFFLGGRLDRRAIVATKAACQVLGHGLKLAYFGSVIADPGSIDPAMAAAAILASLLGTMLARRLLEAMTDQQFRLWAGRIVTSIACYYVAHGSWLLVAP